MLRRYFSFVICYDTTDGGSGGGSPAAVATPPAPAAPAPAAAPASSSPTTRTGTGDPTPGARTTDGKPAAEPAKKYEYENDRSKWVDPATLESERTSAAQLRWEHERLKKMVEAGTGFKLPEPEAPEDPQIRLAREGFLKLAPATWVKVMDFLGQQLEKNPQFLESLSSVQSLRGAYEQGEVRRNISIVDSIFDGAAKELGTTPDKLTQFQKTRLGNGFIEWLESDATLVQRYAQGQTTELVGEYITEWRNGFLTPGGRVAAAPAADQADKNRRLPSAPRTSGVPAGGGNPPPKPQNEDEVHDRAYKGFMAALGGTKP